MALQIFVKTLICKTIALEVESSDATMSRQRSRTYVHYLRWLVHQILHLVVGSIFLMPMGCNTININLYAKRYFIASKCDNLYNLEIVTQVKVVADNTPPSKTSTYARFRGQREVAVVAENIPPSKTSTYARFRGRREVAAVAENIPPSKTSVYARFQGRREVAWWQTAYHP